MQVGINLAGAEYFSDRVPGVLGVDYRYPSHEQIDYYVANGVNFFRISVLWERLQTSQNGPLSAPDIAALRDVIDYAASVGAVVDIDVHNYGEAFGGIIGSAQTPISSFADLWGRLANEFRDDGNVVFGLMNEPSVQSATQWLPAVNAAIAAIRDAGADQKILVPGAYWDGAWSWTQTDNAKVIGTPGNIVDPLGNYAIEVHQYLDDTSGRHEWVVSETIGVEYLRDITEWARATGTELMLTEFGSAVSPEALAANKAMLDFMNQNPSVWTGFAYLGGGWTDAATCFFSAEPENGLLDRPQLELISSYSTKSTFVDSSNGSYDIVYTFDTANERSTVLADVVDKLGKAESRFLLNGSGDVVRSVAFDDVGRYLVTDYEADSVARMVLHDVDSSVIATRVESDKGFSVCVYQDGPDRPSVMITGTTAGTISEVIQFSDTGYLLYSYSGGLLTSAISLDLNQQTLGYQVFGAGGQVTWSMGAIVPAASELPLDVQCLMPSNYPGLTAIASIRSFWTSPDPTPQPDPVPEPPPPPPVPPLALTGFNAGSDPDAVPLKGTVSLTFNQTVTASSGLIQIHNADGTIAAVIAAGAAQIAGTIVTIKLPAALLGGTSYYLTLDPNAFFGTAVSAAAAAAASSVELEFRTEMNKVGGTARPESLSGSAGGDVITGLAGNDTLLGLAGDDVLDGGTGADIMTGGKGNDTYIVDATTDKIVELANEGIDTVLSTVSLTLAANVENLTLGGAAAINATGNVLDNVLIGNNAANVLAGLSGRDTLYGMGGNDTLDGGAGADLMYGGAGNDSYVVENAGDQVVELAGEGIDTVLSSVTYSLADNIENLTLTGTAAINGTGNELDNVLVGNSAANTLIGGAGNDRLDGGTGNDTMIGGVGNDTYVVNAAGDSVVELADQGVDTVLSSVTYTLGANLENLTLQGTSAINGTGNALNNIVTGNSAANTLTGNAGDDMLYGLAGNDTLIGGQDSDWLVGGAGLDKLTGGAGADFFVFDTAPSKTNLDTIADFMHGEDVIVLDQRVFGALGGKVESSEFAIGTKAPNASVHLFYNSGTGALYYDADGSGRGAAVQIATVSKGLALNASDFLVADTAAPGAFANAVAARALNQQQQAAAPAPVESGSASSESVAPPPASASVQGRTLNGTSRADTITGTAGDDTISGLAGNDKLRGGDGNDRIIGGDGSDELTGGAGTDHFVFDTRISKTNIDRITDFAVGTDRIVLDHRIFAALGETLDASEFAIASKAPNADTHLIYNNSSGALYYDADGSGRGAMVQFATLQSGLHLGAADFLIS